MFSFKDSFRSNQNRVEKVICQLLPAIFLLMNLPAAWADETESSDRVLAPYFLVKTGEEQGGELPLQSTQARVTIAGVIADVTITQRYHNTGKVPLEAIYVFPGSTRAAMHGMKMRIGERILEAKIKEKGAAKETYEEAKKEGKSTALLEQQRPNVFQMNVANIMPGDEIVVDLTYSELMVPSDGTYQFVYPTVVGPRYSNIKANEAAQSEQWVENPYLKAGEKHPFSFDINVELVGAIPIQEIASPSHKVSVNYPDKKSAEIKLAEQEAGDRDFILRYRFEGSRIETGALLYEGFDENFFLLMVEPPVKPAAAQIPPREYIFVVDVSGSMKGFPLTVSKGLLVQLVRDLRPQDKFNVILFAGGFAVLSDKSLEATPENRKKALDLIDNQQGGGGTELLPALKHALAMPHDEGISRSIVLVTDGYINADRQALDLIHNNLGNANVFTFGIGTSVNRYLLEGLARAGRGEPEIVLNFFGSSSAADRFRKYISTPLLTDIKIEHEGLDVYDMEPLSVPDLFAGRPIVIFGKWRGRKEGSFKVSGKSGDSNFEQVIDLSKVTSDTRLHALRTLWARQKVATLADYNRASARNENRDEIIKLGLRYDLLTDFTSFVAVDRVVRNKEGELVSKKQPLPLPKGVSNLAVGNFLGTSPEPEFYLMLLLTITLMGGAACIRLRLLNRGPQ